MPYLVTDEHEDPKIFQFKAKAETYAAGLATRTVEEVQFADDLIIKNNQLYAYKCTLPNGRVEENVDIIVDQYCIDYGIELPPSVVLMGLSDRVRVIVYSRNLLTAEELQSKVKSTLKTAKLSL